MVQLDWFVFTSLAQSAHVVLVIEYLATSTSSLLFFVVCFLLVCSLLRGHVDSDKENSLTRSFFRTFWQTSPWQWGAAAAEDSLTRCLEIQRAAIADFNPDVVVGSSWGGGIALLALAEGLWSGPTVAIAPALHRVLRDSGELKYKWAEVEQRLAASAHCLTLVHGAADDTIPIADSETLAAAIHCELVRVDGGDHGLNDALLNGRLRELVVQRHEAYQASTM
mmetsp:Transcript_58335/g.188931  ORF Transcript_58335/g.188931 Transcript_58335/m.188931 type:complete len:223 (-) Transcript_58335:312-980(-)